MRSCFPSALLLLASISSGYAADRVSAEQGRIVVEDSSGRKTILTDTGRDSDPWISPDGRTVVFLRHPVGDIFRNSVYEIDMRTRASKLLLSGPVKYQGREISFVK